MSKEGEILKELREKNGLTQRQLAKISGVTRESINMIETGKRAGMRWATAKALAKALGVTADIFSGGSADVQLPEKPMSILIKEVQEKYAAMELVEIPLRGTIPAGYPFPEETQAEEYIEVPRELLGADANHKDIYARRVSGESLNGDGIYDQDIVIIKPTTDIIDGKIYALELHGERVARHVFKQNGTLRLVSSNGNYKEIQATEVEILGRIILSGRWKRH